MLAPLTNAQLRKFKAAAQHLEPMLKVGKAGFTEGFIRSVDDALARNELVKIKFVEFKEEKKNSLRSSPKRLRAISSCASAT